MQAWLAAASVYRDRRLLALLFLGFSSGLPLALTFSTLTVWLAESGVQKGTIGLFAALGTPYALKFLWAPLMDRAPLPGLSRLLGRRRGWMLGCQLALMLGILALGAQDPVAAPGLTALLALIVAFFSASQDIVIDAYRVEILEERQYAAGAAVLVFGYRVAMLVSGAGALYLAAASDWFAAYGVMAALMLVGMITVLLNPEPEVSGTAEIERRQAEAAAFRHLGRVVPWLYVNVASPFLEFVSSRGWLAALVLGFVIFYKLGDSLAGVMTMPFLVELGFTKVEIANVNKLFGFAATIAGLALGGWLLGAAGMIRSLWICGILQLASNLMFAVQAEVGHSVAFLALTIGIENLAGGMGTAVFVAYLSSLCNVAYTATQYALLSSLFALPRTLLSAGSGFVAEALAWTDFFIFTAVGAVPGLLILWWLTRPGSAVRPNS